MAGRKNKGKKQAARESRGPLFLFADAVLTLLDTLCRGLSGAAVGCLRLALSGLALGLKGVCLGAKLLIRAALWPLKRLWRLAAGRRLRAARCLRLSGEEFEAYCADVLRDNGFRQVELTPMGGDQGVDILAVYQGESWAVQCKNYADAVGNFAVQEACAGRAYYGCDRAAVLCPGAFTRAARELAEATDVDLWDAHTLSRMMKKSGRVPRPGRR